MKVTLIEAPICKGSPTDGSQYAYRSLTEGGLASCFYGLKELPSKNCSTQPWVGGGAGRETT